jgi:hypothetical protein
MKQLRLVLSIVAVGLVTLLLVPDAYAQATRTWVSGVGDDVNPCSRTAPCKTFAGAISKTAAGGEISVLDPGGFGAVTITKAITINGTGTLAGILASLTNGIIVNAAAGDKVIIRNISINGAGNGINGIRYLAGGQLTVENVTIEGFTGNCIDVALATAGELMVQDTNMTKCNNGIRLSTTAGLLLATLDRVRMENMSAIGLEAAAGSTFVVVKRSTINNNNTDGVRASGGSTTVTLDDTMLSLNSGTAVNAFIAGARIRIKNCLIVNNLASIAIAGGAFVESTGNNGIAGNPGGVAPNATFTVQ